MTRTDADDTAAATETCFHPPEHRFLPRPEGRLNAWCGSCGAGLIGYGDVWLDADEILRLRDEARQAQQLRAALEHIVKNWEHTPAGRDAKSELAALEASTQESH